MRGFVTANLDTGFKLYTRENGFYIGDDSGGLRS